MYLVVGTVLILAVVIGVCVLAMKVREISAPFRGEEEAKAVLDLVKLPSDEFGVETVEQHLSEYLKFWTKIIEEMAAATNSKASSVSASQVLMLVGLIGTSVSFFLLILSVWA
jgi:hypothetical protein